MGWFSDDDETSPKGKFSDACLLMDYIDIFASLSTGVYNRRGWDNFTTVTTNHASGGGAHEITAKLTSRNGLKHFLNISPATLSILMPKVRIFKLLYENENSKPTEKELVFEDFYSKSRVNSITSGGERRIGGVGLKSFDWELAGTNPAEADKCINVNCQFEFQSMQDLIGKRFNALTGEIIAGGDLGDLEEEASFLDLIFHSPQKSQSFGPAAAAAEARGEYVPKFFRMKAVVGWAVPSSLDGKLPGMSLTDSRRLKAELGKMNLCLILNLVSHKFDIKENGGVTLDIEYIGALEETINGNTANILEQNRIQTMVSDAQSLLLEQDKAKLRDFEAMVDCLNTDAGGTESDEAERWNEQIDDLREEIAEQEDSINDFNTAAKAQIYKQFLSELQESVLAFDIDEDDIEEWTESLGSTVRPDINTVIDVDSLGRGLDGDAAEDNADAVDEAAEEAADGDDPSASGDRSSETKESATDPDKGRVHYIYFGDLLNLACRKVKPDYNSNADHMNVLCGPVIVTHPRDNRRIHMNLADIPISYDDFQTFFFETVVRKQLASYPLRSFIADVLERLVKKVLQPNECFVANKEHRAIEIGMNSFAIDSRTFTAIDTYPGRANLSEMSLPAITTPGEGSEEADENCLMLFLNSYRAADLRGDPIDDGPKGIYHYNIGAEAGIMKKASFSRADVQGLREARQAESRNLGQIRDVYNASMTMVGNTLYIPGMKLFLNPPYGLGDPTVGPRPGSDGKTLEGGSLANLLGMGGYYDVIKVKSKISRGGQYDTELELIFAQSGAEADTIAARCSGLESTVEREVGFGESLGNALSSVGDVITSAIPGMGGDD